VSATDRRGLRWASTETATDGGDYCRVLPTNWRPISRTGRSPGARRIRPGWDPAANCSGVCLTKPSVREDVGNVAERCDGRRAGTELPENVRAADAPLVDFR